MKKISTNDTRNLKDLTNRLNKRFYDKINQVLKKSRVNSPRYVHYVGFVFQYSVHNMESSLTLTLLETQSMCKREKDVKQSIHLQIHMVEHQIKGQQKIPN